jgi:hypothetical protein
MDDDTGDGGSPWLASRRIGTVTVDHAAERIPGAADTAAADTRTTVAARRKAASRTNGRDASWAVDSDRSFRAERLTRGAPAAGQGGARRDSIFIVEGGHEEAGR